jgi:hypothetical protein
MSKENSKSKDYTKLGGGPLIVGAMCLALILEGGTWYYLKIRYSFKGLLTLICGIGLTLFTASTPHLLYLLAY